jgi:hypothetical protein
MPKKSKYNLKDGKLLVVPRDTAEKYITAYKKENWAEAARDVLEMATAAFPMKEEE